MNNIGFKLQPDHVQDTIDDMSGIRQRLGVEPLVCSEPSITFILPIHTNDRQPRDQGRESEFEGIFWSKHPLPPGTVYENSSHLAG